MCFLILRGSRDRLLGTLLLLLLHIGSMYKVILWATTTALLGRFGERSAGPCRDKLVLFFSPVYLCLFFSFCIPGLFSELARFYSGNVLKAFCLFLMSRWFYSLWAFDTMRFACLLC